MPGFISDNPLAHDLIRIGNEAIANEDDAKLRAYFAEDYTFHGPGSELGYEELRAYFASLRSAFTGLRIVREQIIVEGKFFAARTVFSGDFTDVFAYSPIGPVNPTGEHIVWEVIGTFRYDSAGRLAEEWVQNGLPGLLNQAWRNGDGVCRRCIVNWVVPHPIPVYWDTPWTDNRKWGDWRETGSTTCLQPSIP